jgi:ABC-2 type transport system permease protein
VVVAAIGVGVMNLALGYATYRVLKSGWKLKS